MKRQLKQFWANFVEGVNTFSNGSDFDLGCRIVDGDYKDEQPSSFMTPVKNLVKDRKLTEAAKLVNGYVSESVFSEMGRPLFSDAGAELTAPFDDDPESVNTNIELLDYYQDWYESSPDCPFAAASYARGLQFTGHSLRGTGWIDEVNESQIKSMEVYNNDAALVFAATYDKFHTHWYWATCYMHSALTLDLPEQELWERFHQCVASNSQDVRIYEVMSYMMLPRWHGSFADVNLVATKGAVATEDQFGMMMYVRTFASLLPYHNLYEFEYNWPKLKEGFQDWLKRFPSDYVATLYASALYRHEEYHEVLEVMEGLETLYVQAWEAEIDYDDAYSVCQNYVRKFGAEERS